MAPTAIRETMVRPSAECRHIEKLLPILSWREQKGVEY
jgi:hypothetical protein